MAKGIKRNVFAIFTDGTEKDISDKFTSMNDALFSQIQNATRKAGRPVPVNYRVEDVEVTYEDTDNEIAIDEYENNYSAVMREMNR